MSTFHLKIVTPSGVYAEKDVNILNIRTTGGQMGILAHHLPLASAIEISEMNFVENSQRTFYAIGGGFVYVGNDETTIIANSIESQEEINLARATQAKERAEKRLQSKDGDIIRAEIALRKALNRIHVKNL